jgi:hypothetical protein
VAKAKTDGGNKAQMVRDALEALGGSSAKPLAIQDWIKEHHGVTMEATMISSYKSNEMKKAGGGKAGRSGGRGGDVVDDIATIRNLLKKYGRSSLVKLIEAVD